MKVLFEYNGILPVTKYGGTERLIYWLIKELSLRGHDVFLIADGRSDLSKSGGTLIPREAGDWRKQIPKGIDLIHMFYPPPPLDVPCIVTIGGNGKPNEEFHPNSVFVSKSHAKNHSSESYVLNCLDFDEYPFIEPKKNEWKNFFFLAKASWKVKNLKHCIAAAKHNKKHLHIAGGKGFSFSSYIHYYGMMEQMRKPEFISSMDALLFPVRWHEPFGIAIVEAFAYGKPVIGSPFGSLPELITKDVGIICQNYEELENALASPCQEFDPYNIRHYVEQHFSLQRMTDDYLRLYEKVVRGEKLNATAPLATFKEDPENILPF